MKLGSLIVCLLLVLPLIVAGDHKWKKDHKWNKAPFTCRASTDNGKYCLGRLYHQDGDAWSSSDELGNTFYFNFCGDLSSTSASDGTTASCDPTASSCVKTSVGTFVNAGRPADDSLSIVADEESSVVELSYTNGDLCPTQDGVNYQTVIQLSCDPTGQDLLITSSNYNSSSCQVTILGVSKFACPRSGHWRRSHEGPSIFAFLFPLCCCCSLCICIAACCRRRRRMMMQSQQTQHELRTYTAVPQEDPTQPQQQQQIQIPQPYIIPTQFQPQYFQPSQYYVYVPQYTQQQHQQQVIPEFGVPSPAAPVIESVVEQREAQLDQDEKLARDLQAKFDNE